jgi:hypothetical protein
MCTRPTALVGSTFSALALLAGNHLHVAKKKQIKNEQENQRGFIYTENKPLGHLLNMWNQSFHEFRVVSSANGFQLIRFDCTYSPQRL